MAILKMFANKIDELMWRKKTLEENLLFLSRNKMDCESTLMKLALVQSEIIDQLKKGA
jgi:hypothetical protein